MYTNLLFFAGRSSWLFKYDINFMVKLNLASYNRAPRHIVEMLHDTSYNWYH